MKLLILSDLHLELGTAYAVPHGVDYDVVVLAGDIQSPGHKAALWAKRQSVFGGKPVVLVPGNHEFYGRELGAELEEMSRATHGSNVHMLDCSSVVLDGVRIVGCTLWTDFALPVRQSDGRLDPNVEAALEVANRDMVDYARIKLAEPLNAETRHHALRTRLLQAEDTLAMHHVQRDWLRRELAKPHDGPTVVVTHHAPSAGSTAAKYEGDELTPAFVSDLPGEFFRVPALWVHGHTHTPTDHLRGRCRVISNPRGYRARDGADENHQFEPGYTVELENARSEYVTLEEAGIEMEASTRPEMADMVGVDEAARLAGVSTLRLLRMSTSRPPTVIALRGVHGRVFPAWQFGPRLWPLMQQLPGVMQAGGEEVLAWLERPLGALQGRTPRTAIEQGEPDAVILELANWSDT